MTLVAFLSMVACWPSMSSGIGTNAMAPIPPNQPAAVVVCLVSSGIVNVVLFDATSPKSLWHWWPPMMPHPQKDNQPHL